MCIPNMRRWRYVMGEKDPHATITNGVLDSSIRLIWDKK